MTIDGITIGNPIPTSGLKKFPALTNNNHKVLYCYSVDVIEAARLYKEDEDNIKLYKKLYLCDLDLEISINPYSLRVFTEQRNCKMCGAELKAFVVVKSHSKIFFVPLVQYKNGNFGQLTIDHITPKSKGGSLDYSNKQSLCYCCNSSKGNDLVKNIDIKQKLQKIYSALTKSGYFINVKKEIDSIENKYKYNILVNNKVVATGESSLRNNPDKKIDAMKDAIDKLYLNSFFGGFVATETAQHEKI